MVDNNEIEKFWLDAKKLIAERIGKSKYKNWVEKIVLLSVENGVAVVSAKSSFVGDIVSSRYSADLVKALNDVGLSVSSLDIKAIVDNKNKIDDQSTEVKDRTDNEQTETLSKEEPQDNLSSLFILDTKLRFETFVVGRPNEFAYAAAMKVAEAETVNFNPLFLYGGVGLGKTHLMHSIAWYIKNSSSHRKVVYLSAEKFMYLFIRSLRYKDAMAFKERFRNVDVLMIDDIQFIGGKDATQEEFFHTFNALVDNNRQIVLSADKSPSDLSGLEERLKSRLGWGLVADIHPATYELRLGVLQLKAKGYELFVPPKVLEFLACKITSNIRELEGGLNRIIAHATFTGKEVTIDLARDVLKDLLRSSEMAITIEGIQKRVCEYYGVKFSDLISTKRNRMVTRARQVAMYLIKQLTTKSYPEIGRNFGGKNHATVIHSINKIIELINTDREFSTDLEVLQKSLES
jgi:chromosomal replication initiator protein